MSGDWHEVRRGSARETRTMYVRTLDEVGSVGTLLTDPSWFLVLLPGQGREFHGGVRGYDLECGRSRFASSRRFIHDQPTRVPPSNSENTPRGPHVSHNKREWL